MIRNRFHTVVCARPGTGAKRNPPDPGRIIIRARLEEHLEALRKASPSDHPYR